MAYWCHKVKKSVTTELRAYTQALSHHPKEALKISPAVYWIYLTGRRDLGWRLGLFLCANVIQKHALIREGSVVGGFPDLRQLPGEIVFGKVRSVRYYEISKTDNPTTNPLDTWFIMTNLPFVLAITIRQTLQSTWPDWIWLQTSEKWTRVGGFSSHWLYQYWTVVGGCFQCLFIGYLAHQWLPKQSST